MPVNPKKKPKTTVCKACNGTGKSSRGGDCFPCTQRKTDEALKLHEEAERLVEEEWKHRPKLAAEAMAALFS